MIKKKIRCKFIGNMPYIKELLKEHYIVEECDNPDFAFFTCAQMNHCYKYDCVRILEVGENQRPNFNLFDYAYGFDKIDFGNRYLYYPLYANLAYRSDLLLAMEKHLHTEEFYLGKKKFCNMVVSNVKNATEKRIEFFQKLCEYKQVDSGGKSYNNLPDKKPVADKLEFQKKYKFSIAFENSSYPGYTTEKITQAWAAGTIPIYWGDPTIGEQLNEEAFINCHKYNSWDEVIEKIIEIDQNDELYLKMQKQPISKKDSPLHELIKEDYFNNWLFSILDQEPSQALKRTNAHDGWGYYAENDMKVFNEMIESRMVQFSYRLWKMIQRIKRR